MASSGQHILYIFTSAKEGVFFMGCVCVFAKLWTDFDEKFQEMLTMAQRTDDTIWVVIQIWI